MRRARTLVALIEPASCFAGVLAELVLAADRSLMLDGTREGQDGRTIPPPTIRLTDANDGAYPMSNGLESPAHRGSGAATTRATTARAQIGKDLDASDAARAPNSSRSRSTTSTGTTRCG